MSQGFLIDTNVLIWLFSASERISRPARKALNDSQAALVVSVASVWEIVLKHQAGKLDLGESLSRVVDEILYQSAWTVMPVAPEHLPVLAALPMHHRDPFDRLLVAQAKHAGLTIVTSDQLIRRYDVPTLW